MTATDLATAQRRAALQRALALAADQFSHETEQYGKDAARLFTASASDRGRSQVQQLLTIANSARSVSEVLDFIKRQIGKDRGQAWRSDFGHKLIERLGNGLKERVADLDPQPSDAFEQQQAHLALIRRYVAQIYANYEYYRAQPSDGRLERGQKAGR